MKMVKTITIEELQDYAKLLNNRAIIKLNTLKTKCFGDQYYLNVCVDGISLGFGNLSEENKNFPINIKEQLKKQIVKIAFIHKYMKEQGISSPRRLVYPGVKNGKVGMFIEDEFYE